MNHSIGEAQRIIQECCDPSPYEMGSGRDVGVLLIHGFTASPTETRPLAEYIAARENWRCKGILLPGHGVSVEALEKSTAAEWLQSAVDGYAELARECRQIFLSGVSMGAVLCCHIAERYFREGRICGLLLLSPSFGLTRTQVAGVKLLKHVMRFKNKSAATANTYVERKIFSYTRVPLRKVDEVVRLGTQAFDGLAELKNVPILMLAGTKDTTVSVEQIRKAARLNSRIRFREFENSKHVLTVEADKQEVFNECLQFMRKQLK